MHCARMNCRCLARFVVGIAAAAAFVAPVPTRSARAIDPPAGAAPADLPFFGNERVLLVANGASSASISLARRYAELRHIPIDHLLILPDVPGAAPGSAEPISLDECREQILKPLLTWMKERALSDEIDAIVYSCSFPHAVDVAAVMAAKKLPQQMATLLDGTAALTGLTYFAREVAEGDTSCIALDANKYAKTPTVATNERNPTDVETKLWDDAQAALHAKKHAEAAKLLRELAKSYSESGSVWYDLACCEALLGKKEDALVALKKAVDAGFWNAEHAAADSDLESLRNDEAFTAQLERMRKRIPAGPPSAGFGDDPQGRGRHYLSMMIGWIGPFGTSYADALAELERTAAADGTNPKGTFYFLRNGDVRATTRAPLFPAAMAELKKRGRSCELLEAGKEGQDGILPQKKSDVPGATVGLSDFVWDTSGSTILPGAIVEHLTSCGGMFQGAGQTKLTAFLKAGAAGASGTVTEPYALQAKFPTPLIHVYYVDGCSLAEAFYQSLSGPYQLIIVGDPCCRPFAKLAKLELAADSTKSPWTGSVTLAPKISAVTEAEERSVDHFEAWIDGTLAATSKGDAPLALDTTKLADGPHELHVVAIGPAPIGVPTAIARRVTIANHGLDVTINGAGSSGGAAAGGRSIEFGKRIELAGRAPVGARIEVLDGGRVLFAGTCSGSWRADVASAALGLGKATLRARAISDAGIGVSDALEITTTAPNLPGAQNAPGELLPGLAVDVGSGNKREHRGVLSFTDAIPMGELAKSPQSGATALVHGFFQLPAAGLHEWSFGSGDLRSLMIDGKRVVADDKERNDKNEKNVVATVQGFALELANGWHSFELELAPHGGHEPRLSLFGPNGAIALNDGTCGQGPGGLKRVAKEKLAPKNAAWTDGNRAAAAAPSSDLAEIELKSAVKVGAVAVYFAGLGASGLDVGKDVAIETRDSGAWSALSENDLRVLRSAPAGAADVTCMLVLAGGRKASKLRVKSTAKDAAALKALAEIELWEGTPKN